MIRIILFIVLFGIPTFASSSTWYYDCIGDISEVTVKSRGELRVNFVDGRNVIVEGSYSFVGSKMKVRTQVWQFDYDANTNQGVARDNKGTKVGYCKKSKG